MKRLTILIVTLLAAVAAAPAQNWYKQVRTESDKCFSKFDSMKDEAAQNKCIAAAEALPKPIDAALDKCLAGKHGTFPRAECYSAAEEAWEKDVTMSYAQALKLVPAEVVPKLKANQAAWEKFKESLTDLYATKNAKQRGTGHIAGRIIENIDIYKPRALFLEELVYDYDR